ncbi:MAG: gliding motility-associated ABC transporter substrate-binding protein GldG [Bacteroidales bacterium]|jgi:gliding-associated putative ABC transporter substrate-binding component GldG|nr:gliding motility-associated ABC transporter substrate-binding protein GldG [Bacteroidales bacterium]
MISKEKQTVLNNSRRFKKAAIIGFVTAFVILIAANLLSAYLFIRIDLTNDKRHSISKETIKILKELDDKIYIKVYLKGSGLPADYQLFAEETRAMLQEIRSYSKNIYFEFIDPVAGKGKEEIRSVYNEFIKKGLRPQPITREDETGISTRYVLPGAIITYKNSEYPVVLMVSDPSHSDWLQYSIQELEYNLVATIRKLVHPVKPKVAFLNGHGELNFLNTSWMAWQLQRFYNVEFIELKGKVNTLKEIELADSSQNEIKIRGNKYDVLIVAQPTLPFNSVDNYIIDQHIMYGGKVLWLIDASTASIDSLQNSPEQFAVLRNLNLNNLFFRYGVRFNANIVQDLSCQSIPLGMGEIAGKTQYKFFAFPYALDIVNFSTHTIVRKMKEIKSEFAGTIDFVGNDENLQKTVLMTTSEHTKLVSVPAIVTLNVARAKPNIEEFAFKNQPVAVLVEGTFKSAFDKLLPATFDTIKQFGFKAESPLTRQIFIADGDIIRNYVDPKSNQPMPAGFDFYSGKSYDNSDLIMNCVNYLCSDNDLLQIRSKIFKIGSLDKTKILKQQTFYAVFNIVAPLLLILIAAGVLIIWRNIRYGRRRIA